MSSPVAITDLASNGVEPWLIDAIGRIARSEGRSLEPYLTTVGEATVVSGAKATCRCHFVRIDPHGTPRVPALTKMLCDQVVDYCIPRTRIKEAQAHLEKTGSTEKILQLQREAKSLFTSIKTTGEGGELLLYAMLEIALGIPQVLCKMSLKTNSHMHYHGVDGVHAKALNDGTLAVYWGEAKLYASANGAIDAAIKSLAPYLLDNGSGASQRDVLLLRENADTGDPDLTAALIRFFTEDDVKAASLVVRGACLIGFSMDPYAHPLKSDGSIQEAVSTALQTWHDRLGAAIGNEKISQFELEVFFVPLPDVQDFRDQLISQLGLTN